MPGSGNFVAVDWGAVHRRVYTLSAEGAVLRARSDDLGALSVLPGGHAAEIAGLRARHGPVTMLLAGMIGSSRGWLETPCVPSPCCLADLAAATLRPQEDILLVPGVSRMDPLGRADIMRGEEVQLLGAVAGGLVPSSALLCRPGGQCRWAWIAEGCIADFATAMTGELFSVLRTQGLLAPLLGAPVTDGAAFARGLAEAGRNDLPVSLFGAHAAALRGTLQRSDASAFVFGLLVGSDVAVRLRDGPAEVHVLGGTGTSALYARAIRHFGGTARLVDGHRAFVAGITAIRDLAA